MNELQLLSHQQPGSVSIDNLQELKTALTAVLARYENVVYTERMLSEAKADKKELSRLRRDIDDRRKEIKRAYLAPYKDFEAQVKELLAMIDAPLERVKEFVGDMEAQEKDAKREKIEAYYLRRSASLGAMARRVWESPAFFDPRWLNKTTSAGVWQAAVDEKIAAAARDLRSIQTAAGQHVGAVTTRYLETLSMDGMAEYRARLASVSAAGTPQPEPVSPAGTARPEPCVRDNRTGSKVLKISGDPEALTQALELLELLGLDCEILEDDTPQPMPELTEPDFDSFVAFDLETSGTYGAANGDAPAEITEIGAVRVTRGEIVDTFSLLVDPGRKILPRISRITHITDAMVAGQPGPEEAIRQFADFVGDSILVGHNIKTSDLHYIDRAAKRAGVRMENPFFDTCRFARVLQPTQGWKSVKLEDLAALFSVAQPEAHRAWCDAQANACVYLKLKELA